MHASAHRMPFLILSGTGVFFGLIAFFLVGQRMTSEFAVRDFQNKVALSQQKIKQENEAAYQALLKKQAEAKPVPLPTTPFVERHATGAHTIHIVLVRPETLPAESIAPLIGNLQSPNPDIFSVCNGTGSCSLVSSLRYVETYYREQAKRYRAQSAISVAVHGPYAMTNLEKVGDIMYSWGKDAFGVAKLEDAFDKILTDNNIVADKDAIVVYLYFDNSFDGSKTDDVYSFYEHKKFRSFANQMKGHSYINVYNLTPAFSGTVTEIVVHETLHLFGASDKYIENPTTRICQLNGRGNTTQNPPLPQTTGDIMCLYVEKDAKTFTRGSLMLRNLVVNEQTAKEIGWSK